MALRPEFESVERLAKVRLVLMDIDGTLISANRHTFSRVVEYLRKLKILGISFSLATGRTIFGAREVWTALQAVQMRMPPMIAYNGAVVFSGADASLIDALALPKDAFRKIVEHCRQQGLPLLAYACQSRFDLQPAENVYTESDHPKIEFNGMVVQRVDDILVVEDRFVAVLIETPKAEHPERVSKILKEEFGKDLRITTSGGQHIEVCHPQGTKLDGMKRLSKMCGVSLSETMAIGDNYNDLEMIRACGVGVAVANAPLAVRDAAALVCHRAEAEGVIEALRVLVRSRRSAPLPTGGGESRHGNRSGN